MKQLPLNNPAFISVESGFKDWLEILGYAPITVYNMPNGVREFLHWLGEGGITPLKEVNVDMIADYYCYLKGRCNERREGRLSNAYLNKHQQAIKKFNEYLQHTQNITLPLSELASEKIFQPDIDIITVEEINEILTATQLLPVVKKGAKGEVFYKALQYRDRAMIAIFYGCGLRRNEGVQLDVTDINFSKGLLHVRKGKNYTERIVPVSRKNLYYLRSYIRFSGESRSGDLQPQQALRTRRGHSG